MSEVLLLFFFKPKAKAAFLAVTEDKNVLFDEISQFFGFYLEMERKRRSNGLLNYTRVMQKKELLNFFLVALQKCANM